MNVINMEEFKKAKEEKLYVEIVEGVKENGVSFGNLIKDFDKFVAVEYGDISAREYEKLKFKVVK